ncbi:MAG: precorrin-2 dehydrogenase/sirohydrochlorin ferrochelatase family protein [Alphaproteobacteria bacterium]
MALTYPVQLLLAGKLCVVVGGGDVAFRKARALLAAEGRIKVIAPALCPELEQLAAENKIEAEKKTFSPSDLAEAFLVIAATDDSRVNQAVFAEASAQGILVNVVDKPELCNFYVPSVVRRGDLIITISTGGASPALAKKIRQTLEEAYGEEYEAYLEILNHCRELAKQKYPDDLSARMAANRRALAVDLVPLLRSGQYEQARKEAEDCI